ncbi:hypothetical protein BH09PSE1_BH09PSE1_03210 [soil metagenome]
MAETRNQTIQGRVKLDGKTFVDCEFVDAQLIFEGGLPPNFANCRFSNTSFTFDKEAANTVNFLRAMLPIQSNMRQVVLNLMPELTQL